MIPKCALHDEIGKDVSSFWKVYQQHLNKPYVVQDIMKPMIIGILEDSEKDSLEDDGIDDDPYAADPAPHPAMIVHSLKPLQLELPKTLLLQSYITPIGLNFVRNHHPCPIINADEHVLEIFLNREYNDSENEKSNSSLLTKFSVEELKTKYDKIDVVVSTQCGGNRRSGYDTDKKRGNRSDKTMGCQWDVGAISTGT